MSNSWHSLITNVGVAIKPLEVESQRLESQICQVLAVLKYRPLCQSLDYLSL